MERVVRCQEGGTWGDTPVCVSECKFHNCTKEAGDLARGLVYIQWQNFFRDVHEGKTFMKD